MPRRKLALSKETLSDLSAPELASLAGGAPPTWDCQTVGFTCTLTYSWRFCPTELSEAVSFHSLDPNCIH